MDQVMLVPEFMLDHMLVTQRMYYADAAYDERCLYKLSTKTRGLAQPKMFLYFLAKDATNYSTTYTNYTTKCTRRSVRTRQQTTDKDEPKCNAQKARTDKEEPNAVATNDLTCTRTRCTHATRHETKSPKHQRHKPTARPYATCTNMCTQVCTHACRPRTNVCMHCAGVYMLCGSLAT